MATNSATSGCPVTTTLGFIGGKWKPVILFYLTAGTRRFGEIAARIPTISRKVLTEQLKELERDGLILRVPHREIPPRVDYSVTDLGKSLTPIFNEMAAWARRHALSRP